MKRVLIFSSLVLLSLFIPSAVLAQMDDFNDGNDTGWDHYDPLGIASFTFTNRGYRIQTAPSPNPMFGKGRAGSLRNDVTYTNFYVYVDITNWNDNLPQSMGILARVTTPGFAQTKAYAFTHDRGSSITSGDVDISRIDGEVPTGLTLSGADRIRFEVGKTYRMVFIGIGSVFEGRVYEHPNLTNPVVRVSASDPTYEAGICGLVAYDNSGTNSTDTTFDNYFAIKSEPILPPPLRIERASDQGLVTLSWPTNVAGFVLQGTADLSSRIPQWADITDAPSENNGRYEFTDFATSGNFFYRLRRPAE